MNKIEFLEKFEIKLREKGIIKEDKKEILDDYKSMIEEAILNGESETAFIESLGSISSIIKNTPLRKTKLSKFKSKWIALTPFISVILFFLIGFLWNGFEYSWMVFLMIPVSAIALESRGLQRIIALYPFVATVLFFVIGFAFEGFEYAWLVFTPLIPLSVIDTKAKFKPVIISLQVLFIAGFAVLQFQGYEIYHYLLWIPVALLVLYAWISNIDPSKLKQVMLGLVGILVIVLVYLALGFWYNLWHPAWLIFLLIPIGVLLYQKVIEKANVPFVSFSPFIAVISFFLIGEYLNGYAYAWLVFLIIPILGVLEGE